MKKYAKYIAPWMLLLFENYLQGKISVYFPTQCQIFPPAGVEPRTIKNTGHCVVNWATTPIVKHSLKINIFNSFAHEFCP